MTPKFRGKIFNGVFLPAKSCQASYAGYLDYHEGQDVECIIQKPKDPKTMNQLAYFHGVVAKIASEASGYDMEEVKGLLKGYFLTKYIKAPDGQEVPFVPSLADMKKPDMSNFIEDCIRLIAEHWGAVVPAPGETDY